MTSDEIKNLLMYYGGNPSGRDFAMLSAIAAIIAQKRPWVGLTDEEALDCWPLIMLHPDCAEFWKNIEAKLKAKNEH
jgi:hypothetical protein